MVDGSIDKITQKNIFILKSNHMYAYWYFIINWRRSKEVSIILPLVGGFVEGGMVVGSIDKITHKKSIFILKSYHIYAYWYFSNN